MESYDGIHECRLAPPSVPGVGRRACGRVLAVKRRAGIAAAVPAPTARPVAGLGLRVKPGCLAKGDGVGERARQINTDTCRRNAGLTKRFPGPRDAERRRVIRGSSFSSRSDRKLNDRYSPARRALGLGPGSSL